MAVVKTVALLSPGSNLGGAERALLDLARSLKRRATDPAEVTFHPWVLLPLKGGALERSLQEEEIDFDILPPPRGFFELDRREPLHAFQKGIQSIPGMGLYLAKLAFLLKKKKPCLLHSFGGWTHGISSMMGSVARIPSLWFLRELEREGPVAWTLKTIQKTTGAHVVAGSRAIADVFSPHDARVPVLHPGVEVPAPVQKSNPKPKIGLIGSLKRAKGQEDFIAMASLLIRRGVDAEFVLAGHHPVGIWGAKDAQSTKTYEDDLRKLVASLGLQTHVRFLGFQRSLLETLRELDILVFSPRHAEGVSRVLVEALGSKVAVVASKAGGALDLIRDGENGLLFESSSEDHKDSKPIERMADCVETLIKNSEFRKQLTEQARRDYLERWTLKLYSESVVRIYQTLIKSSLTASALRMAPLDKQPIERHP